MKVYGNSSGDGFAVLCTVVGALFVAGGLGLSTMGGVALPIAVVAVAVTALLMVQGLKRWDPMTEVPAIDPNSPLPAGMVSTFQMPAVSDASATPAKPAWSPAVGHDANLPAKVDAPKPAIETNTPVA
jgi:hypothetical protein